MVLTVSESHHLVDFFCGFSVTRGAGTSPTDKSTQESERILYWRGKDWGGGGHSLLLLMLLTNLKYSTDRDLDSDVSVPKFCEEQKR